MVRFKHRYLLCELVSEDPRCRACLEERVLFGLVRDAIARVHGAFGAAACAVAFTGTIRTCQKFLIQYNRRQLLILLHNCPDGEERESIKKSVMSCSLEEPQEDQLSGGGSEEDATEME
uniref:Ribonuclease P/MRP protein subunit POP5 n=1 Tax=Vombatus ursinus TaxID=29139 RepID=A0A4X2KH58_VOMUR